MIVWVYNINLEVNYSEANNIVIDEPTVKKYITHKNKEMFDNKDDEEIKMVFYNVGGVRTKAMKNPLELNGVRINSGNVSVNENENECDDVLEKEKSV